MTQHLENGGPMVARFPQTPQRAKDLSQLGLACSVLLSIPARDRQLPSSTSDDGHASSFVLLYGCRRVWRFVNPFYASLKRHLIKGEKNNLQLHSTTSSFAY